MIKSKGDLIGYLLEKHPDLDTFYAVFGESDRFAHYFYHFFDADHPYLKNETEDEIIKYTKLREEIYIQLDKELGKIIDNFNPTITIVLSDHGFGSLRKLIHLNKWLSREGFLTFKPEEEWESFQKDKLNPARDYIYGKVDWSKTKAYSIGKRGVFYVNLEGREPRGIVKKEEYAGIRSAVISSLEKLKDPETEKNVVEKACTREKLFKGDRLDMGPDVIAFFKDGYGALGYAIDVFSPEIFSINDRTDLALEMGIERGDGILAIGGAGIKNPEGKKPMLQDLAPTILHMFNIPIPTDVDGIVLDVFSNKRPIQFLDGDEEEQGKRQFSKEEENIIKERLSKLGYIQ